MGMSFTEIMLIAAVAVLVLGPKQAAQLAFKAGSLWGKLRSYLNTLKRELNSEASDLGESVKTVKDSILQASTSVKQSMNSHNNDLNTGSGPCFTASYKPAAVSSSELLDEIATLKLEIASMKHPHKFTRAKVKSTRMRRHSHVRSRAYH